ncbi:MAG: hypothetical protein ACREA2_10865 [Blastocatellia bacterium]
MTPLKTNRGQFKKGHDPRRHVLTPADRVKGFWRAIYSIIQRHPDAVDSSGRHMAFDFLKVAGRQNKEKNR